MLRHIKLSEKQKTVAVCVFSTLAVAGLLGGVYSLSASADDAKIVNLPSTTIENRDITWSFGNNENLTLTLGAGPILNDNSSSTSENNISYPNGDISISLTYTGSENVCGNYDLRLDADGWQGYPLDCNPGESTSVFSTSSTFVAPSNVNAFVLSASKRNNPGPNAPVVVSIATNTFDASTNTATFNLGNTTRSISFTNAWNSQNNPHFEFENTGNNSALQSALSAGLGFTAEDACMDGQASNYVVQLGSQDGWSRDFTCNNGVYTLVFQDNDIVPTSGLSISIQNTNQPGPQTGYDVAFENVSSSANDGSYVLVTSHDQSLAGKTFRLTPSTGEIGCAGDQNGLNCSMHFNNNPFDTRSEFYFTIRGEGFELNPEDIMVFLRGPDGKNGVAEISRVGDNYQFMLRNSGVPGDVNHISIDIEEPHEEGQGEEFVPHPGEQVGPTRVTIKQNQGNPNIAKSFYLSRISINWEPVFEREDCEWSAENRADDSICPATYTRNDFTYNKESNVDTVEIDFGTIFNLRYINTVKVNGTSYEIPFDYTNRQQWLAHYDHQMTGFTLNVPYSSTGYTIEVDVDQLAGEYQQIGNFLWTNSEDEKYRPDGTLNDEYIGHSNLEVVSVNCHITSNDENDVFFRVGVDQVPEGCVFEYSPDDDRNTTGSLVVPEGSTITVRLKPQYGWQVTSFRLSGNDEIATDPGAVAQYTLGIHRGNAHIGAVVTEVDDEVNASSDKIKSGSIMLGGAEIEEGTAMLSVNDADLNDDQKAEFRKQAGNYSVSTFLDIDLDQVFYDGKGGYWQGTEMSELSHEATITLTLEDGVDGNSVILVHKKHDGSYEIIPTTYDAKTHTISFKASSFSDYAIASATIENTNTFDSILKYFMLFVVSGGAAIFFATRSELEAEKLA